MLDFLNTSSTELVPVDDDPDVIAVREPLVAANASLAVLEIEEKKLIRLATGREVAATDEELDDAQQRLAVVKGTQNRWYLPELQAQREEVKRLTVPYEAARAAAKLRLNDAGLARLKPLYQQLADALREAQTLALALENVCQEIGLGGIEKPEHPFPSLLAGGIIAWQLDLAKQKGLCT